jgi:hypothetical protein
VKTAEIEEEAPETLTNIFADVSFADVIEIRRPKDRNEATVDWLARLRLPEKEVWLLIEVKSSGEPRWVRDAANQVLRDIVKFPHSYGVLIAPWVSPRAAEICRQEGVGYADLAGNCRLTFDSIHIERQGIPNPSPQKRALHSLYSPRATRVLRVLLHEPHRQWKLQALAEEAQVSLGQVHKVKSLLAGREWIRSEPDGMSLSKPAELLAEWATNYTYRRNRIREYYSLKSPGELENDLAEACVKQGVRYALAGFSAAARLAPFVRYQRASAYLDEASVTKIAEDLNLKEVSSGANVTLWVPYDEYVWHGSEQKDNARVTSPIQTFLDLKSAPGRGEEAADFLLKEVIKLQW